jgi:transposase
MPSRVAGIDVHKKVLMVVIRESGEESAPEKRRKFITTRSGLAELAGWLGQEQVDSVVMESTAQYWWPVWLELEPQCRMYLAQARSNAAPHGRKTDFGDARRLSRRFFSQDLRYSFVPAPEQRGWRRLTRTWKSLGEQIVEIRNEIEAMLEEGQVKLSSYLSDLIGKTGRRMLRALANGTTDPMVIAELKDRRIRASTEELMDALNGKLGEAHRLILRQHLDRIEVIERQRLELEQHLMAETAAQVEIIQRLCAVPGINVMAAYHILAEIGPEANAFPSARQLASWAGVCPGRNESAEVSRSDRCAKGNRFVRSLLAQIAHAATRTKGSYWEDLLARLSKRLGLQKALWAVAHRMLRLIWKLLHDKVDYLERGPRAWDQARIQRRMRNLKRQFAALGYQVTFQQAVPE